MWYFYLVFYGYAIITLNYILIYIFIAIVLLAFGIIDLQGDPVPATVSHYNSAVDVCLILIYNIYEYYFICSYGHKVNMKNSWLGASAWIMIIPQKASLVIPQMIQHAVIM